MSKTSKQASGPKPLRGVRNPDLYPVKDNPIDLALSDEDKAWISDQYNRAILRNYDSAHGHIGYDVFDDPATYKPQRIESLKGSDYGSSMFDEPIMWGKVNAGDIQDARAYNQPWYSKLASGVGKMGVTALTTIAETAGLGVGLVQGAIDAYNADDHKSRAFLHAIWDNPVTQALQSISDWSEEYMPNYYTQDEMENPLAFRNIFSANFLGDKIIKNIGFMIGAYYGGLPFSKLVGKIGTGMVRSARSAAYAERMALGKSALSASEKAKKSAEIMDEVIKMAHTTRATSQFVGSMFSAFSEGAIEALNNSRDWANLATREENDRFAAIEELIRTEMSLNPDATGSLIEKLDEERQEHEERLAQIEEGKARMGNADMLMNIPILTASNFFQWGRLYNKGFDSARRQVKDFWGEVKGSLAKGDLHSSRTLKKAVMKAALKPQSEGLEEYLQRAASDGAGYAVQDSIDRYINSKKDKDATADVGDYIMGFAKAIVDNSTNPSAWEEYLVGTLSAMLGMPVAGRAQTKNAWVGKDKAVGLAGGFVGEIKEEMRKRNFENKLAEHLNGRVKKPEFKALYEKLIANNHLDRAMRKALTEDEKLLYKDLQFDQLFNDIEAAYSSGHISEFKTLIGYNTDYDDDAELAHIVEITKNPVDKTIQKNRDIQRVQEIEEQQEENNKEIEELNNKIATINEDGTETGESLTLGSLEDNIAKRNEWKDALSILESENKKLDKEKNLINARIQEDKYDDTFEGPFMTNGIGWDTFKRDEMIKVLEMNRDKTMRAIDNYLKVRDNIDIETGGNLSDDNLSTLTKMRMEMMNDDDRLVGSAIELVDTLREKDLAAEWENLADILEESLPEKVEGVEEPEEIKKDRDEVEMRRAGARLLRFLQESRDTTFSERKGAYRAQKKIKDPKAKHTNFVAAIHALLHPREQRTMSDEEIESFLQYLPNTYWTMSLIGNSQKLSLEEKQHLNGLVWDLSRLGRKKLEYREKLRKFIGDPELLTDYIKEAEDRQTKKEVDNNAEDLSLRIKEAKSLSALDEIMNEAYASDRSIAGKAFDKAMQTADEDTKKFLSSWKEGNDLVSAMWEYSTKIDDPEIANNMQVMLLDSWKLALKDPKALNLKANVIARIKEGAKILKQDSNPALRLAGEELEKMVNAFEKAESRNTTTNDGRTSGPTTSTTEGTPKSQKEKEKDAERTAIIKEIRREVKAKPNSNKIADLSSELQNRIQKYKDDYSADDINDNTVALTAQQSKRSGSSDAQSKQEEMDAKIIAANSYKQDGMDDNNAEEAYDSVNNGPEGTNTKSNEMSTRVRNSFLAIFPTRYKIWKSKEGAVHVEKNIEDFKYEPDKGSYLEAVSQELNARLAYDFLDKNYLGYIVDALGGTGNVPIYFLKNARIHNMKDGQSSVFLAIKLDEEGKMKDAIRDRAFNGERDAPVDSQFRTVKLEDENGKLAEYQIVGHLSIADNAPQDLKNGYSAFIEAVNSKTQDAMAALPEGSEYVLVPNVESYINDIFTGRLEKSDTKITLKEFMTSNASSRGKSNEWDSKTEFFFGINKDGTIVTNAARDSFVDPAVWAQQKRHNGHILLFIPKPDGKLYPIRCTRRTVGEWTHLEDLYEIIDKKNTRGNNYIIRLATCLMSLFDESLSDDIRLEAKYDISEFFNFGDKSPIQLDFVNKTLKVYNETISKGTAREMAEKFMGILKDHNIQFTISLDMLKTNSGISGRDLIEADIFTVGLNGFYNFNSSFTITPVDAEGKNIGFVPAEGGNSSNNIRIENMTFDLQLGHGERVYYYDPIKKRHMYRKDGAAHEVSKDEEYLLQELTKIINGNGTNIIQFTHSDSTPDTVKAALEKLFTSDKFIKANGVNFGKLFVIKFGDDIYTYNTGEGDTQAKLVKYDKGSLAYDKYNDNPNDDSRLKGTWFEKIIKARKDNVFTVLQETGEGSGENKNWTIKDAKKGDIIYDPETKNVYVFHSVDKVGNIIAIAYYDPNDEKGEFFGVSDFVTRKRSYTYGNIVEAKGMRLATAEERQVLFDEMDKAGYEYDEVNKEVKEKKEEGDTGGSEQNKGPFKDLKSVKQLTGKTKIEQIILDADDEDMQEHAFKLLQKYPAREGTAEKLKEYFNEEVDDDELTAFFDDCK